MSRWCASLRELVNLAWIWPVQTCQPGDGGAAAAGEEFLGSFIRPTNPSQLGADGLPADGRCLELRVRVNGLRSGT